MRYIFIDMAWDEYLFWQKNDKQIINNLMTLQKEYLANSRVNSFFFNYFF